jgi:polyprenyldihydroxybenzoate methyltransferase/3-demethylubiquinol 3-O-methyltransferase
LSTVARTPLAYFLTIFAAEKILRLVEPGTHTFSKYINPSELVAFFQKDPTGGPTPWITQTGEFGLPTRAEGEVKGIIYEPWRGDWRLMPRSATPFATASNYLFWVRRPKA